MTSPAHMSLCTMGKFTRHRRFLAKMIASLQVLLSLVLPAASACADYASYAQQPHPPFSGGRFNLSAMRPPPECRTFAAPAVEAALARMQAVIADPDLYRLFSNAFPSSLDTAVKWRGRAADNADEELAFIVTGDIDAMWLRDSTNQLQAYGGVLETSGEADSLAALFRGVINLQGRYVRTAPFCNAFQPPPESGIAPATNDAACSDCVSPSYAADAVFECKFELDSVAAFLALSGDYYRATGDGAFFDRFQWAAAVQAALDAAEAMTTPTYGFDGAVLASPYSFTRQTMRASETLTNDGAGNPTANGTGLVRSAFRPSDDATVFQLLVPANMLFSAALEGSVDIARQLKGSDGLADRMAALAASLRSAIVRHGVINSTFGAAYAYEIDGFGSTTVMDDANVPSLLAAPAFGFVPASDPAYSNTRALVLSAANPYLARGRSLTAVGSPHTGPGWAWPLASIMRARTSNDAGEVRGELAQLVASTAGLGLMHESVWADDATRFSRPWFGMVNSLFGQMVLELAQRMPDVLNASFQ